MFDGEDQFMANAQDIKYGMSVKVDGGGAGSFQTEIRSCFRSSDEMATGGPPQLDADAIKMFIGQIPKAMVEEDLKKFLEEYGPIYEVNIVRDKLSGQSKGCAFVTFCTRKDALAAQMALHNIKLMPGLNHPIQMKPADGQANSVDERRLFVGMLSKKMSEAHVTMLFAQYGTIDDCVILKDAKGESRGCAFVTFANKLCAQTAIKAMHHSQTMEGCKMPIVVKIADTQRDKDIKRFFMSQVQHQQHQQSNPINSPAWASQQSQYLALLQQALPNANLGSSPGLGNMGAAPTAGDAAQLQQLMVAAAALVPILQSNPGLATVLAALGSASGNPSSSPASNLAMLQQLAAVSSGNQSIGANAGAGGSVMAGKDMSPFSSSNVSSGSPGFGSMSPALGSQMSNFGACNAGSMNPASSSSSSTDMMNKAYSGFQQYMAGLPESLPSMLQSPSSPVGGQSKGPEGANLFIYHLPREFRDLDLTQMFMPFGTVLSAKVFIDKKTNQSKCFGFVSFENPLSAQSAIQAMNGFQIGSKRLKVSLKNLKTDSKPY